MLRGNLHFIFTKRWWMKLRRCIHEAGLKMDEFHTGGDEVPEGAWTKSPLAAELMKKHPEIRDPKNLQTYFFRELLQATEEQKYSCTWLGRSVPDENGEWKVCCQSGVCKSASSTVHLE